MQHNRHWWELELLKKRGTTLRYAIPMTGDEFQQLQFVFVGVGIATPYQSLMIFAETHDKTIDYNQDHRYPKYYVPLYKSSISTSHTEVSLNVNDEGYVAYRVHFDLLDNNQRPLGGAEFLRVVERYVIVIELSPEVNGHDCRLWFS